MNEAVEKWEALSAAQHLKFARGDETVMASTHHDVLALWDRRPFFFHGRLDVQ